jgi:hypothetical protein
MNLHATSAANRPVRRAMVKMNIERRNIDFGAGAPKRRKVGEMPVVLKDKPILEPVQHGRSITMQVLERSNI